MPLQISLILGGARSGKSRLAEDWVWQVAKENQRNPVYLATAKLGLDDEMQARIAHHQRQRQESALDALGAVDAENNATQKLQWHLIEEPENLAFRLHHIFQEKSVVLVDCMSLWLNQILFDDNASYPDVGIIHASPKFTQQTQALWDFLAYARSSTMSGHLFIVSNEVGWGITPLGAVSRCFVDEMGRMNQNLAQYSDKVIFVAAGLPLYLKGEAGN